MSKQRRSFSPEFKRSAASLVLDQSYSHVDASRSVGVAESVLRRWVQQLHQERHGITPQSAAMTQEQQRIQELEARVERLEREKIILKNVWSAPDLQVTGFASGQNGVLRQCIRPTRAVQDCWP